MEETLTPHLRPGVKPLLGLGAHSDDLAFSLGGALLDGRLAACRPVTVFSRSAYTSKIPRGDVELISALRREEDRRFFSFASALAPLWLDLLDAPLRRGLSSETVFSASIQASELTDARRVISSMVPASATVLAPLALGNHVDHRLVRDVACALHRGKRCDVIFYEDLPYAAFMSMPAIDSAVRHVEKELGFRLSPMPWPSSLLCKAKELAVESYASQTDEHSLQHLLYHAQRLQARGCHAERVWYPLP